MILTEKGRAMNLNDEIGKERVLLQIELSRLKKEADAVQFIVGCHTIHNIIGIKCEMIGARNELNRNTEPNKEYLDRLQHWRRTLHVRSIEDLV